VRTVLVTVLFAVSLSGCSAEDDTGSQAAPPGIAADAGSDADGAAADGSSMADAAMDAVDGDAGTDPDGGSADADADVPLTPDGCLDGGTLSRAPTKQPLHAICGIASNPGDMPIESDPASAFLRKGYFDAALDLGGVSIRRDVRWQQVEPEQGKRDFSRYDAFFEEAKSRGVRILGSLLYGTTWAHAGATDEFYPPDDPDLFADFAGTTAARYRDTVTHWEIWNEPNAGWRFWKGASLSGDPVAYATLLERTHAAIAEKSPGSNMLFGGTVFTPQLVEGALSWIEKGYVARPELPASFEVMGIHTYMRYPPRRAPEAADGDDPTIVDKIRAHQCLLAAHGIPDKPMWITEIGWPVTKDVDEAAQARFTVRATVLAAQAGVDGIFWYTLRDGPFPEMFPPEDAFGLLHNDQDPAAGKPSSPKPVYVALRALLATTGERPPTNEQASIMGLAADGYAVVFQGNDPGRVTAAWTVGSPAEVVWTGVSAELRDQSGTSVGSVSSGETVTLGNDVTYLVEP
jgi:polysaccharide biosynthesis protein PslG